MRFAIAFLSIWLFMSPVVVKAEDAPVVIELFTSQGCSSCPPADKLLSEIAKQENVIALAFHVDYWDYLGWKDRFADASFTSRQKAYAHVGKRRTVFTPELVVQGTDSIVGHKRDYIRQAISAHAQSPRLARLSVSRGGNVLTISISPINGSAPSAEMLLVRFLPDEEVMIERGENKGRTILYTHIVSGVSRLGAWDGKSEQTIQVENASGPLAVIAQQPNHGPILSAVRLD